MNWGVLSLSLSHIHHCIVQVYTFLLLLLLEEGGVSLQNSFPNSALTFFPLRASLWQVLLDRWSPVINDLLKRDTVAFISWPQHTFNLQQQNCWSVTGSYSPAFQDSSSDRPHRWAKQKQCAGTSADKESQHFKAKIQMQTDCICALSPLPTPANTILFSKPLCWERYSTRKLRSGGGAGREAHAGG